MRKTMLAFGAWLVLCMFATIAAAQGTGRIDGEIIGLDGQPYADKTVTLKNPDTGQVFTLKTDKNGKFTQLALRSAIYTVTLPDVPYSEKFQVTDGQDNNYKLNLKDVAAASAAAHPEEAKKKEDDADKFKNMKAHFDAGVAAMAQSDQLRTQIRTASTDQKSGLQSQRTQVCTTAVTEFSAAAEGVTEKDVKNHAMILGNLGQAQECAGKYDDAAGSFQKAIDLQPSASYYTGLATNLANVGAATKDPAAADAKFAAASDACTKGDALGSASGAAPAAGGAAAPAATDTCWKNLGIVLSNKGALKAAIPPLQKATTIDPKDQQAWYLLGSAYTGTIDTKQEGDKMTYIIPPGTKDAFQKCIDLGADNALGQQCKQTMDGLAAMGGGEDTSVGKRPAKKKS
jgi:tetratricopeptide (TPR) repeat protein